jgi:hypothetical protein
MVAVALMLSGCATGRMYPGPELPEDKTALITEEIFLGASLTSIDGKWVGPFYNSASVLPGEHFITASFSTGPYGITTMCAAFKATVSAGAEYKLEYDFGKIRLTDKVTGKTVGEGYTVDVSWVFSIKRHRELCHLPQSGE